DRQPDEQTHEAQTHKRTRTTMTHDTSSPNPAVTAGAAAGPTHLDALPDSGRRVALLLRERGHAGQIVTLPETGKTSAEAAAGLNCAVAQIAKSILFRRREDDAPVLVVASGANRVDA